MSKASYLSCVKFSRSSSFKNSYKCEQLIEQARNRIANLSRRTKYMISLSCEDIAQLLRLGLRKKALLWAEQLYEDQRKLSAYEQIDNLCAEVLLDFDIIISKQRELPAELKAAVCTLIFAASRYGELPELHKVRKLFKEWWGDELISTNVDLLPGNLVNPLIMDILMFNPMLDDAKKLQFISEIVRDHNVIIGSQSNAHKLQLISKEDKHDESEKEMEGRDRYSESEDTPDEISPYPQGTPDSSSPYTYKNVHVKMESYGELSSRTSSEGSNHNQEEEIVYLNNINKRLKSPPPPYTIRPKTERVKL